MNKVNRFIGLGRSEKSLFVRAFLLLVWYRLGLWIVPFRWAKMWINRDTSAVSQVGVENGSTVKNTIRSIRLGSRYVPFASCLTQALAARTLLHSIGQPAVLKIGVANSDGSFEAHAWLEIDGEIVLGKQPLHSRYAVLGSSHSVTV